MPSYAYARAAHTVDRMIRARRYGFHENSTNGKTYLRRDTGDRICRSIEIDFDPKDVDGEKIQRTDRRFIISTKTSAGPLLPHPDNEMDSFVIKGPVEEGGAEVELIITAPPKRLRPAGVLIYWDIRVRSK